jgi:hypothetical protein
MIHSHSSSLIIHYQPLSLTTSSMNEIMIVSILSIMIHYQLIIMDVSFIIIHNHWMIVHLIIIMDLIIIHYHLIVIIHDGSLGWRWSAPWIPRTPRIVVWAPMTWKAMASAAAAMWATAFGPWDPGWNSKEPQEPRKPGSLVEVMGSEPQLKWATKSPAPALEVALSSFGKRYSKWWIMRRFEWFASRTSCAKLQSPRITFVVSSRCGVRPGWLLQIWSSIYHHRWNLATWVNRISNLFLRLLRPGVWSWFSCGREPTDAEVGTGELLHLCKMCKSMWGDPDIPSTSQYWLC